MGDGADVRLDGDALGEGGEAPYRRRLGDRRGNGHPAGQCLSRRPRQYGVLQLPRL